MNIDCRGQKRERFLIPTMLRHFCAKVRDDWKTNCSILSRMLVFVFLAVPTGVDDDYNEDYEPQCQENNHAGLTFPNLLYAIRKLGPIHVIEQYTFTGRK